MGGGRALQIGPAHKGGCPGRGNTPDVEVLRLGHSGTIVSLWHFCISFPDAYTEGAGCNDPARLLRIREHGRCLVADRTPPVLPDRFRIGVPYQFDTPLRRLLRCGLVRLVPLNLRLPRVTHWPDLAAALQGRAGWRRVERDTHHHDRNEFRGHVFLPP